MSVFTKHNIDNIPSFYTKIRPIILTNKPLKVFIYLIPPPWVECDTISISKWNTTDLNAEFSFS